MAPAGTSRGTLLESSRKCVGSTSCVYLPRTPTRLPAPSFLTCRPSDDVVCQNLTETLLALDVNSYEYVGLSHGFIRHPSFCGVPAYVEGIQRFYNVSGLAEFMGTSPSDVR